jgi:hypothetical protein
MSGIDHHIFIPQKYPLYDMGMFVKYKCGELNSVGSETNLCGKLFENCALFYWRCTNFNMTD